MNPSWIEVPLHMLPQALSNVTHRGVLWQANADELLLNIPGQARFWVQRDQPIRVARQAAITETSLSLFLQGLPLAAYYVHRHCLTLHAASIVTPQGTIVLAGHSATGKSTLAAALVVRGNLLLADEITPIPVKPGQSIATQIPPQLAMPSLHLWRDALAKLAIAEDRCTQLRPGLERYAVPVAALLPQESQLHTDPAHSLRAIYLLGWTNEREASVSDVAGYNRFLALQPFSFNRLLPASTAHRQQHFLQSTLLLAKTPIRTLRRPREGWSIPTLVALLEQDLGGEQ